MAARPYVGRSPGLGDELDFVPADERTLQSRAAANVFVIGDAANVPTSKTGSVTHFEGETLVNNVGHFLAGESLEAGFDGHANCFVETGFHLRRTTSSRKSRTSSPSASSTKRPPAARSPLRDDDASFHRCH
jgi:NADPH-dependent 2,4-dienoyl-CoA reductase/sulfur reductase-like enzyme